MLLLTDDAVKRLDFARADGYAVCFLDLVGAPDVFWFAEILGFYSLNAALIDMAVLSSSPAATGVEATAVSLAVLEKVVMVTSCCSLCRFFWNLLLEGR